MAKNSPAVECFGLFRRGSDDAIRRLMVHYFETHEVAFEYENVKRFRELYDYFLHTLTPAERNAERFSRLFRASFLGAEPRVERNDDGERRLHAELERVTARCQHEEGLRLEEEQRRQALGQELNQLHGCVYRNRYSELALQIAARVGELQERDETLQGEQARVEERLAAHQALAPRLATPLEKELHGETQVLLSERVEAVTAERETISRELHELTAEEKQGEVSAHPLLSALYRMHQEAQAEGVDAVTGLPSRDSFDESLRQRLAAFHDKMDGENFSLVFLALTGLSANGSRHGQGAILAPIQAMGHVLQTLRRHTDTAYRYGEAEFVILLPNTPAAGALIFTDYLRGRVVDLPLDERHKEAMDLSVNMGVCDALTGGPAVVRCAAQACERAKAEGRDSVVLFDDATFLGPPPADIPAGFLATVREYLLLQRTFSVVGLKPYSLAALAELAARVQEEFAAPAVATEQHVFVLLEEWDAEQAIWEVDERLRDLIRTAGAADISEVPAATVAAPTARTAAILSQMLEMLG